MPLVGNLRDFALHDFLYLIDRGHKTGSLLLRSHNDSAALYFDAGKLISVTRPQRRERLGEFLMRTGKITPDQLRQALDAQGVTNIRPIGKILVEQGAIDERDLQTSVQAVIEDTVYALFTWKEGEFEFKADVHPAPDDIQTPVPIAVENLIMEGVRRVDELTRIKERIPHNDMIVRFTPRANDAGAEATLTAEEWRIFARVNNRSSVKELAEKLKISAFESSSIIFGLVVSGLLEVAEPARPAAPAPPPYQPPAPPRDDDTDQSTDALKRGAVSKFIDRIRGT